MKAIIIATGHLPECEALSRGLFPPMVPLIDRPFIQHVVEFVVGSGAEELHVVLCHSPERIEALLGDGTRWGRQIHYHFVSDPKKPYEIIRYMAIDGEPEVTLLAQADRLPQADLGADREQLQFDQLPLIYCPPPSEEGKISWSGWGWFSGACLAQLPLEAEIPLLERVLAERATQKGRQVGVDLVLDARSYAGVLEAHRRVISKEFDGLITSGREVDEGIWLSRNVSLHPMARLHPPVYIGENCRIGAGVDLGPNAVVSRDCVLDKGCLAENAVILPGSYVGEVLELVDVVVDKNRLVNVRLQAMASVVDDFILGSMAHDHLWPWIGQLISRLSAVGLLLVLWPLLLLIAVALAAVRKGAPVVHRKRVVRLPAPLEPAGWGSFDLLSFEGGPPAGRYRHFFLHFLPALINIARGELRFVGVPPRTKEQISQLQVEWQSLYLVAKSGIVDEAYLQFGTGPSDDESYSTEAFYAVTAGLKYDFKLMSRYCAALLMPWSKLGQQTVSEEPVKAH